MTRALVLAVALLASHQAVAQYHCTSPQDTRCPPSYWLNPTFSNPGWWSQAGQVSRTSMLRQCAQWDWRFGTPPSWCAAAMAGQRGYSRGW